MDRSLLRALEESLLTSDVRRDPVQLAALLHAEFVEIGRSGRRRTRAEIIAALSEEDDREPRTTDAWEFSALSPS